MFVLNEDYEILNLAQCIKIVVIGNEIKAYTTASYPPETNLIASFETEVEAGYAYFELFKALKAGKRTWDPDTIKPLSTLWDKIDEHLETSDDVPEDEYILTSGAKISAFSLDTVTIKHDVRARSLYEKYRTKIEKKVAKKLQELLGDEFIEVKWTFE